MQRSSCPRVRRFIRHSANTAELLVIYDLLPERVISVQVQFPWCDCGACLFVRYYLWFTYKHRLIILSYHITYHFNDRSPSSSPRGSQHGRQCQTPTSSFSKWIPLSPRSNPPGLMQHVVRRKIEYMYARPQNSHRKALASMSEVS